MAVRHPIWVAPVVVVGAPVVLVAFPMVALPVVLPADAEVVFVDVAGPVVVIAGSSPPSLQAVNRHGKRASEASVGIVVAFTGSSLSKK